MAVEHNTLPQEAQHIIHRWKVADETEFNAIVPNIDDTDKIALRVDNDTFYRLKSHDPIEWVALGTSQTVDLSNYYTKDEVYTKSEVYAKSEVYNKTEIDNALDLVDTSNLIDIGLTNAIVKMTQIENSLNRLYITKNQWYKIPFNKKESDSKNMYDTTNHRIVIPANGFYLINYYVRTSGTIASSPQFENFGITKNSDTYPVDLNTSGITIYTGEDVTIFEDDRYDTIPNGFSGTKLYYFNAGDVIRVWYKSQFDNPSLISCNDIDGTFGGTHLTINILGSLSSNITNTAYNAYELAVQEGFVGTLTDWLNSLKGADGSSGLDGTDGLSAYQVWLNLGNTGTEQDFINSLKGDTGATGADGTDGVGVPTGGTAGQILAKVDNTDYNTQWIDPPTGGGSAEYPDQTGNSGKFLGTDGTNVLWDDIPQPILNGLSELPAYQLDTEVLTSERWTNGKPIYKKTIDFGALPNNTTKNVAHGVSDLEFGFIDKDMSYSIVTATPTSWYPLDLSTNNTSANRYAYVSSSNVSIVTYTDRTSLSAIITIRYTKTTDTANSPVALVGSQYNISSTEYILPFTINNKTVYGKEIDVGTLPNSTTKSVAIPDYNSSYVYGLDYGIGSQFYDPVNKNSRGIVYSSSSTVFHTTRITGSNIEIITTYNATAFTNNKVLIYYTKD